jgi:ribosomal protein L12E/L44/L45/RPP1/RPP2
VIGVRRCRELVADRKKWKDMCSTGLSPQWAVVTMEEEEEETEEEEKEEEEEEEEEEEDCTIKIIKY